MRWQAENRLLIGAELVEIALPKDAERIIQYFNKNPTNCFSTSQLAKRTTLRFFPLYLSKSAFSQADSVRFLFISCVHKCEELIYTKRNKKIKKTNEYFIIASIK